MAESSVCSEPESSLRIRTQTTYQSRSVLLCRGDVEASLESHEKTCEPTAGCLREGGMDLDLAAPINELDSGMFADANKLEVVS